jgi:hypothetical protein
MTTSKPPQKTTTSTVDEPRRHGGTTVRDDAATPVPPLATATATSASSQDADDAPSPPPAPPGDDERLGLLANVVEGGNDYDKYDDNDDNYDYPRVTENGRKQPLHVRTPVAPARFRRRAPSAIAHAPRHGGPAEIATQAAGNAPTRLPPTTQSSARPIVTISQVPLRGDFVRAWAYRRAR